MPFLGGLNFSPFFGDMRTRIRPADPLTSPFPAEWVRRSTYGGITAWFKDLAPHFVDGVIEDADTAADRLFFAAARAGAGLAACRRRHDCGLMPLGCYMTGTEYTGSADGDLFG